MADKAILAINAKDKVEILDELPQSFRNAPTIATILQLQGMATAGFSQDGRAGFEGINFPNCEKDLGGKFDSTGGQTTHVFEKLYFQALNGQPTIMFAMQTTDKQSENPIIVRHNNEGQGDGVVVYLPWVKDGVNILDELGVKPDENGLVPKETTMKYGKDLYPFIAERALEFMSNNIANFNEKNIIIDGNYADGIQTALDMQSKLTEKKHAGEVVTIGTFHTHGINKFVDNAVKELGDDNLFLLKLRGFQETGVKLSDIEYIKAGIKENNLEALAEKYSFVERLTIEANDNVAKIDAIMAVDHGMEEKLLRWLQYDDTKVGFALNGYNANVYNPKVLEDKSAEDIRGLVQKLLEEKPPYQTCDEPITISDESLSGTNFITACRPESRKNSDGAIKAFVKWAEAEENKNDKGNLILIGHAPENATPSSDQQNIIAQIQEIAETSPEIANRILLLPSMRSDEIRTILQLEQAVGLAASAQEPWGIGAMEDMASAVPLVTSDLYASAVHVGEHFAKASEAKNSIVLFQSPSREGATPESSTDSFVAAMNEISNNYKIYKGRASLLAPDIAKEFKWEAMVDTYTELENRILHFKLQQRINELGIPSSELATSTVDIASPQPAIANSREGRAQ